MIFTRRRNKKKNSFKKSDSPGLTISITLEEMAVIEFYYGRTIYYACRCSDTDAIRQCATEMYELMSREDDFEPSLSKAREEITEIYKIGETYRKYNFYYEGLPYNSDYGHHYDFKNAAVVDRLVEDISSYPSFLKKQCQIAQEKTDIVSLLEDYLLALKEANHDPNFYNTKKGKEIYDFCFKNNFWIYSSDLKIRKLFYEVDSSIGGIYNSYMTLHR